MRKVSCFLVSLILVSGCSSARPVLQAPDPGLADIWSDFPVASPLGRPMIVLDDLPLTDSQSKQVVPEGTVTSSASPSATPITLHGVTKSVDLISSQAALTAIKAKPATKDAPRAKVATATLVVAPFNTDRGTISLPAWEFHLTGGGTLKWPAMSTDHFWRLGLAFPSTTFRNTLVEGLNLTADIEELWGRPCPGVPKPDVTPVVVESPTFVSVGLKASHTNMGTCDQNLTPSVRKVSVKLNDPLGDRALLDFAGGVVVPDIRE
ncbi:hypothetical protein [Streptosporangium sp. H16]|uniref:hypothetical protein n=1 Tax=Streptosporangium sp. H16 TaxID=3444184 RepID=UPI003F78C569